jgi:hypothetical protein
MNSIFKLCPDLESINFLKCTLNNEDCKILGKILSDYKNVRELDLSGSRIN